MKNYLAYKNQISGFKDVLETVKVTEMIAASSIHYLKNVFINLDIYSKNLDSVLRRCAAFSSGYSRSRLFVRGENKSKCLVVLTGDRGLTGGLWHRIIDRFLGIKAAYAAVVAVGEKGAAYLSEEHLQPAKSFTGISGGADEAAQGITKYIFNAISENRFGEVDILYPQFISLAEHRPVVAPFVPLPFTTERASGAPKGLPIFEPSAPAVFEQLLKKYIGLYFSKILLETKLSELSARTVAMERASAKTDELIKALVLTYQKDRRRSVTKQQLEIFAAHKIL